MDYQRQHFKNGQVLDAYCMNKMDMAIDAFCKQTVTHTPQDLDYAQKAQARENIGVNDYYSTTREELSVTLGIAGATAADVTSQNIFRLYKALATAYPDRVQEKTVLDDGTNSIYEYVISTGEYNTDGSLTGWYGDEIKKPKYLILSGLHGGIERQSIISTYRFIRDIVTGHNIPAQFSEGCVIHVIPVGNPYSLDNNIRNNENGVDINRNFDWNFGVNVAEGKNPGNSAASEKETQAIANWLNANSDAQLFLDCHNQGAAVNEVAWLFGLTDSEEYAVSKKIALRGIDRVIPLWRDTIGYTDKTVYPVALSLDEGGLAIFYASEVLSIPSLAIELSPFQNGSQADYEANTKVITSETAAAGAEVIGNILIEFYKHYGEVIEMTRTNAQLKALTESVNIMSKGFRMESGVFTNASDSEGQVVLEWPLKGVKILTFTSNTEDGTRANILNTTSGTWLIGFVGQTLAELPYLMNTYIRSVGHSSTINGGKIETAGVILMPTDFGVKFSFVGLKAGTYNWTAYYWDE